MVRPHIGHTKMRSELHPLLLQLPRRTSVSSIFSTGNSATVPALKHLHKRAPEVATHCTIQDEVDSAVYERENIPDISEWHVELTEDRRVNTAPQRNDALRQLDNDEAQSNGNEHRRCTSVFHTSTSRLRRGGSGRPLDATVLVLGVTYRPYEQNTD